MKFERAIVIGASSGIGAEIVRQLAADGGKVAAVARRKDRLEALRSDSAASIFVYAHDVHRTAEVPALFESICRDLGGVDLFVYAAGVMPAVGADEFDTLKDEEMIDVNFKGCVAWLNEAAARFQDLGAGTILAIGSVAGDRGRMGQPVYNATKAALHTYLEALRNRLARKGVVVATVKPGPTATEMTDGLGLPGMMSAEEAARRILAKASKSGEHYLKPAHRLIFWIIRHLPSALFRRLKL